MAPVTNLAQLRLKNIAFQGIETLGPLPSPGPRLARAFSFPAGLRPTRAILTAAALGVLAACSATSPFSSVPVAVVLPGGEVLKGGASTRIGRGTFQTSDGRVSCSGSFNPGLISSDVSVFLACSNAQRGVGLIKADDSDSGRATIRLEDRKGEALFVYGEAARRL